MRGLSGILSLSHNEFDKLNKNRSTNVRLHLSYDIEITLKSHFLLKSDYLRNISAPTVNC